MENTKEFVVNLAVANTENSDEVTFKPIAGKIIGCSIYTGVEASTVNPGIVNAAILDSNSKEISRLQHIDNYRNREAAYMKGFKPLNIEATGQNMTYQIIATANMTANFETQLILLYALPEDCPIQ